MNTQELIEMNKTSSDQKINNKEQESNWRIFFRKPQQNLNLQKKNKPKDKDGEGMKNQKYISKVSGLLYEYDKNTRQGMEQRKKFLVENKDYDIDEADTAEEIKSHENNGDWRDFFRNYQENQNHQKKNKPRNKKDESNKNQKYISKSSGFLYDYDINTREGMEQRKKYLIDNEDYDTEEADEAVEKEKNEDEEMVAHIEKLHLTANPIFDALFNQNKKDVLESVILIIELLLTNFIVLENLNEDELSEENNKLTEMIHNAYERKWLSFSDDSVISDIIIDDTEITWDPVNKYKRCFYKKLYKCYGYDDKNYRIFIDRTTSPVTIYKLNKKNRLSEVDGNENYIRDQEFETYDDSDGKRYILIEGDGLQQNDDGTLSEKRKTLNQKRMFQITMKKWKEQQIEKRGDFLELIQSDLELISEYRNQLEQDEQRGNTKDFWEIVYFYLIVGCMNGYTNIFNLRPRQILFLYNSRVYVKKTGNEMLPANLIELSTGSGKTFAEIFMMLFSLDNTDELGPKFFPQYKQHVIWATHNKTFVTQFSKEILPILETPQFGYLYASAIGKMPKNIQRLLIPKVIPEQQYGDFQNFYNNYIENAPDLLNSNQSPQFIVDYVARVFMAQNAVS